MYNLKNGKGTYKGMVGECLFKLTRQYLILPKFFNKNKYFMIFSKKFTIEQVKFLKENWYSIDSIEFIDNKPVLFEIKTRNKYLNPKSNWLPKMTLATHNMYKKAIKLGFIVKVAHVWLLDDWNYSIELIPIENFKYTIDKPKQYDK